tara:strand:+ start:5316 stop:8891 length:3576 start_codon:yes stop_codon:yes gene_type:complete
MKNYFANQTLSRDRLIDDSDFIRDASQFLKARTGKEYDDDEELFEAFVEHMRIGSVSEITAIKDRNYIMKADQESKDQAGRLFLTFDRLKKPTSVVELIKDYGEGLLRAPSTYLSLTGVGILGKGASSATTQAITQTARALATKGIVGQQTKKAAVRGAAIEGAFGAVQGGAFDDARRRTGREEYKDRNLISGALGGALFGAIPGGIGGGLQGFKTTKQELAALQPVLKGQEVKAEKIKAGNIATDELLKDKDALELQNAIGKIEHTVAGQKVQGLFSKQVQQDPIPERLTEPGRREARAASYTLPTKDDPPSEVNDFRLSLTPEVLKNLEGATIDLLKFLGVTAADVQSNTRISTLVADALINRNRIKEFKDFMKDKELAGVAAQKQREGLSFEYTATIQKIQDIQDKYGITDQQFGYMFAAEFSDAGRTLATAKRIKGGLLNSLARETKVMENFGFVDDEFAQAIGNAKQNNSQVLREFVTNLDTTRRGLMTIQMATTMRNTLGGGGRAMLYLLDNMFQGGLEFITPGATKEQRQQAIARMASGFRAWKTLTWNQAEGNALRMLFAEEMPIAFRQLYRKNADVQAEMGLGSGMSKFARKLNVLNTYSDNAFKRAIFMSELQTQVGGKGKLKKLIEEGNFSKLASPEYQNALENSIKEANSTVYQRTYKEKIFRPVQEVDPKQGKIPFLTRRTLGIGGRMIDTGQYERIENSELASSMLKWSSKPFVTWAVPFPKFVMNSLEFVYTHAPVIGLAGLAGTKRTNPKVIAQQLTGMSMLYGALQLRAAQGPEARWYEMYDEETKKYTNTLALYGPFAPYMIAADLLLRSNLNKENGKYKVRDLLISAGPEEYRQATRENWERVIKDPLTTAALTDQMFQEYLRGFFGTTFRTGIGFDFFDELKKDYEAATEKGEDGMFKTSFSAAGNAIAKFGGMYANTFLVGGGMLRDLFANVDPQYAKIRDINSVSDPTQAFIARSLRSLPIDDEGKYLGLVKGPKGISLVAMNATRRGELEREGRLETQFTGKGTIEEKSKIQEELQRLNLPEYKEYRRFKQPELNNRAKILYQNYTEQVINPFLRSRAYNRFENTSAGALRQRQALREQFSQMRSVVRDQLLEQVSRQYNRTDLSSEDFEKVQGELLFLLREQFKNKNEDIRRIAVDQFRSMYGRFPTREGRQGVKDQVALINISRGR